MFTMIDGKVNDNGNEFMNSMVSDRLVPRHLGNIELIGFSGTQGENVNSKRIKDVSRLWQYRNGRNPQDD